MTAEPNSAARSGPRATAGVRRRTHERNERGDRRNDEIVQEVAADEEPQIARGRRRVGMADDSHDADEHDRNAEYETDHKTDQVGLVDLS